MSSLLVVEPFAPFDGCAAWDRTRAADGPRRAGLVEATLAVSAAVSKEEAPHADEIVTSLTNS
jgi:hypothetical protein